MLAAVDREIPFEALEDGFVLWARQGGRDEERVGEEGCGAAVAIWSEGARYAFV